jgi:hypothetical protein
MTVRRVLLAPIAFLAFLALLAAAAPAEASFHLMKVRAVYPGAAATPDDAFVELQMYATGENHVAGHELQAFDASGAPNGGAAFAADVPNGQTQSTILIGDSAVAGADLVDPALDGDLDPAGGAVCWDATHLDCVGWGSFAGPATLGTGMAAPAIADGQALVREISAGCATLLEAGDDTDDSAADFALAAPDPRPNSSPPTEMACEAGAGALQTKITKRPPKRVHGDSTKVKFKANQPGVYFECKLDRKPYRTCFSPRKLKHLDKGRHVFRVRAYEPGGGAKDPTPAKAKFKVV